MKFKLFKNKPILRLERNLSVVGTFHEDERALDSLYHLAENYIKSNRMRIHRVGIEYRGAYREAIGLKNKVAAIFPRKQITLSISGSATAAKFGPRLLAICIV